MANGLRVDLALLAFQNYSQEIPWVGPVTGTEYSVPFGQWEHVHRDDHADIQSRFGTDFLPTTHF